MALQESQSGELHQSLRMWQDLFASTPVVSGPTVASERQHLQEELRQLQHLARENAVLSRGFAGVVRRVLDGVGRPLIGQRGAYGRYGKRQGASAARLVKSEG